MRTSSIMTRKPRTHLPDAESAEKMKAYWRERLNALKALLEG